MKSFDLLEEPFQPAPGEADINQFREGPALVYSGVERELGAFDDAEDDGVLEPNKDVPYALQAEGILLRVHEVLLHVDQASSSC